MVMLFMVVQWGNCEIGDSCSSEGVNEWPKSGAKIVPLAGAVAEQLN